MSEREQFWKECPAEQSTAQRVAVFDTSKIGMIRPAYPAASEWRTDIENAPRDESLLVMYGGYPWFASWHGEQWWIGTGMDGDVLKDLSGITAYAIINPPEAPDA